MEIYVYRRHIGGCNERVMNGVIMFKGDNYLWGDLMAIKHVPEV